MSVVVVEDDDTDQLEPVLVVPPKLAKAAYAILCSQNCVPRPWHPEGRYGSRTHKVGNDKIGLPLLRQKDVVERIQSHLLDHPRGRGEEVPWKTEERPPTDLTELLDMEGVELIYEKPILSNRIPKMEDFDSRVHPEHMPANFYSKLNQFLENRIQKGRRKTKHSIPNDQEESVSKKSKTTLESSGQEESSFTFCELFAGIGGFGVALEALGGKCVFASEIYEPSRQIYFANLDTSYLPNGTIAGDIWDVDCQDIPPHDLLVGGFPCQPFSTLGDQPGLQDLKTCSGRKKTISREGGGGCASTRDVEKGRGQLFNEIVRILKYCQPNAFLLENVPGLLTTDHGRAFDLIKSSLEKAGYNVYTEIISSRGVTAQSRKRLFIVGIKKKDAENDGTKLEKEDERPFEFPFLPELGLRAEDVLHSKEELCEFSSTSVPIELSEPLANGIDSLSPATMFRLSDAQMLQLQTRSKRWKPAKLAWDNCICDTIDSHYGVTVGKGNSQLVPSPAPYHPRRFTPRECARIMGFGNSFILGSGNEFYKKNSDHYYKNKDEARFNSFIKEQYYMLGNAVCPPVVAIIAGAILAHCYESLDNRGNDNLMIEKGLWAGIELALDAVSPPQIFAISQRLLKSQISR